MTRVVGLASVAVVLTLAACGRAHEPIGAAGDAGRHSERVDGAIADAGSGAPRGAPDSGSYVDDESIVIGGSRCGAPPEPGERAPACTWSEETAGTCPSGRSGPSLDFAPLDPCDEAASAGGAFEHTFHAPFDVDASCDGLHIRSAEVEARADFDGGLALMQHFAFHGVVRELHVRAAVDDRGCTRVTRVGVSHGIDGEYGTWLVFAELPSGLGRVWLDDWLLELTWAGPACDTGVWSQCAAFLPRSGETRLEPSLLAPCATSYVPAAIGGCGDEVLLPIVAGPLDCDTPVRIAFPFRSTRPLCH